MATIIEMPKLSDTMVTGKILGWIKNEGDAVESGEAIAEVETDKAAMELEVFEDGVLLKILAEKDSDIPVGGPLAILGEKGEDISGLIQEAKQKSVSVSNPAEEIRKEETKLAAAPVKAASEKPAPVSPALAAVPLPAVQPQEETGRMRISPVAQRMAAEHNIDVRTLHGSGPSGRIVKRDIEEFLVKGGQAAAAPPTAAASVFSGAPYEDIPLTSIRAAMARRLPQSLGPVPHFYLEIEIDAEPLLAANKQLRELAGENIRITVTDLLIKACTVALRKHPEVNSQFNGATVRRFHVVNIGLAVAGEGHLLVPVLKNCESKSVIQIAAERAMLVEKGQAGRLAPDQMSGGTFTISNLGMYGITRFEAIINPPEAAILAVGAIRDEAVVKNGQVVPGKRLALTLSCDHRVFDGAEGAKFIASLKNILENPLALCL